MCAGRRRRSRFSRPIHYNEGYNLSTLPTDLQNGMTFVYTNFRGEVETHTIDYVSETLGYGYMQGTSMACPTYRVLRP